MEARGGVDGVSMSDLINKRRKEDKEKPSKGQCLPGGPKQVLKWCGQNLEVISMQNEMLHKQ